MEKLTFSSLPLLRLEALDADGAPIDSYEQRLGLRTVEASDDGLLLNGEPVSMSKRSTLPHPVPEPNQTA